MAQDHGILTGEQVLKLTAIKASLTAMAAAWRGVDAHNENKLLSLVESVKAVEAEISQRELFFAALAK